MKVQIRPLITRALHAPKKIKLLALIVLVIFVGGFIYFRNSSKKENVTTQTQTIEKTTFISSISSTGNITSGNTVNVSTKASGTVTKVYVKNGDTLKKGQKILDISLDSDGIERRSAAWQAYLKAQENVVKAQKDKQDLELQIWKDRQSISDAEDTANKKNNGENNPATKEAYTDAEKHQVDESLTQARLAFDVTAASLSHADETISAAKISAQAAYNDYLDVSGSILSPSAGILNNLTLTVGSTLTASSSQSTSTGSSYANSQTIGYIRSSNNQYQAQVNLSELDVVKVQAGQKVTLTLDAYSDMTFTGKVLAVNVSGSSSSGVSSYPATILMDATDKAIYPNMSVSATIITDIESDVITVPTTAITKNTNGSTIHVQKNGKQVTVAIETGKSNDIQTIVTSGLSVGDVIVTGTTSSLKNNNTSSVFSSSNNRSNTTTRSFGGGGGQFIGGPGF